MPSSNVCANHAPSVHNAFADVNQRCSFQPSCEPACLGKCSLTSAHCSNAGLRTGWTIHGDAEALEHTGVTFLLHATISASVQSVFVDTAHPLFRVLHTYLCPRTCTLCDFSFFQSVFLATLSTISFLVNAKCPAFCFLWASALASHLQLKWSRITGTAVKLAGGRWTTVQTSPRNTLNWMDAHQPYPFYRAVACTT